MSARVPSKEYIYIMDAGIPVRIVTNREELKKLQEKIGRCLYCRRDGLLNKEELCLGCRKGWIPSVCNFCKETKRTNNQGICFQCERVSEPCPYCNQRTCLGTCAQGCMFEENINAILSSKPCEICGAPIMTSYHICEVE